MDYALSEERVEQDFYLSDNYADGLSKIESRIRNGLSYHEVFKDIDDDLFCYLLGKWAPDYSVTRDFLPNWPNVETLTQSVGSSDVSYLIRESSAFVSKCLGWWNKYQNKPFESASVFDYGCGWGRLLRFFAKHVPEPQLFACDPNPVFFQMAQKFKVPGNIVQSDWMSSIPIKDKQCDLLYSFSILTHASRQLSENILERWREIVSPGGLVVATIRPADLFKFDGGELETLAFTPRDRRKALEQCYAGEYVYYPYEGSPHWGVTVIPQKFIYENWHMKSGFEVLEIGHLFVNRMQIPVLLRRLP